MTMTAPSVQPGTDPQFGPKVGWLFGTYEIEGILGEGGVAKVYRSRSEDGRNVALKVLKQEAAQHEEVRTRFEQEYVLAARLSHPSVVGVLDGGEIGGHTYLTMPAIEGGSLDKRIPGGKRLSVERAISITRQIALALHHVHSKGIVHRDVKPANILLDAHEDARLCDFGLAIDLTEAVVDVDGRLYGTPLYVAPEQTQPGAKLDGRVDLYSLGVVLYRMVTGRAPFYGSRGDVLNAHNCTTPPRPSKFARISPALEAIILKALSKDPAARFQSGAEFATALAGCDLCVQRNIWPRFLWLFCCPTQMMQAS